MAELFGLEETKDYFKEKAKELGITLAFLFGSYARGLVKEESDVDIAVVFLNDSDEEAVFKTTTDLAYDLSRLLKREVSVVPVFRDFRKPMLYYNAIVLGKPIYVKNPAEYIKSYLEALFQMEDFGLFGSRWQLAAASHLLGG